MNSRIKIKYKRENIYGSLFWQVCGIDWQGVLMELQEETISRT